MSSTSTSDHEMSDYSNSPSYTIKESPHSSPSQHVPQLITDISELTFSDANIMYAVNGLTPALKIIVQPQSHFRFRYVSEMVGTHGCLLGKTHANIKTKTHPTVELINYAGKAKIRCSLAQHDKPAEHPHRLLEDDQDRDVSYDVPENGSYKVGFAGMGIIHTAKKDVPGLLFKKFSEQMKDRHYDTKQLRADCDSLAKNINLNIVRLKFSAHDIDTGRVICEPVYSDPILNMKSAATNDLKICRMSSYQGRPRGGEDIFILVEKVNKKKIKIRFYELNENGEEVWSAFGKFSESDVHHQYAIVFRTPEYKDPETPEDVNVFIELLRTTDQRTSDRVEFKYKADQVHRQKKKRKTMSPYSSLDSSSSGSITNFAQASAMYNNQHKATPPEMQIPSLPHSPLAGPLAACGLGAALGHNVMLSSAAPALSPAPPAPAAPGWAPPLPNIRLDSRELDNIIRIEMSGDQRLPDDIWMRYVDSFNSLSDLPTEPTQNIESMEPHFTCVGDSGVVKKEPSTSYEMDQSNEDKEDDVSDEYPAYYTHEDGVEVKKLVKEICDIIRSKKGYKNEEVRSKFERLFEIRLSNGDTFLHMALRSEEPSFESIVKVIYGVKMTHLLNCGNNKQKTILHLAITHSTPRVVAFLVSKGCDPSYKDSEGDNAIHYAVKYAPQCLGPLLDAIEANKVKCDLNECNNEQLSPLHLCVLHEAAGGARRLARAGARGLPAGHYRRTPLHLAALDARRHMLRELLEHGLQSDVDMVDSLGNTALQIVCGSALNDHSVEMVKMLLEHKADPLKHAEHNRSAWKLCRDKPAIREVMKSYVPSEVAAEDEVKSEPEDEYESADEEPGEESLRGLSSYVRGVSALVEAAGVWRALARRLHAHAFIDWLALQPSPAQRLLHHVKECGDVTSKSLALILEDMDLVEAANIVRSAIEMNDNFNINKMDKFKS